MFTKPNPKPNFFEFDQIILKWWKENKILEQSIDQRPEDKTRSFYDGPITANGEPHVGHMLTFAMKDIIPRYWTMKGYKVTRSLGWDCQGIPVEYEVEKKLGFKEKKDIEKFGISEFNKLCRESVMKYQGNIVELEELMGRLTNDEEEYSTMDKDYIESVWWSLKELYEKGHLYEGFKVVPYSTRAGTTLSNAEVALGGYKPFVDPAVTVKFKLLDDPETSILAWTTTPWTLPTNFGLAVGKEIKYVKVKPAESKENYIVAKDLVEKVFEGQQYEILAEVTAADLVGKKYLPLFDFFLDKENTFTVVEGFHVSTDAGTGIVHLAPYGEEDNEIFKEIGITSVDVLDEQGDFTELVPLYKGLNYRDANPKIIEYLKEKNLLFKHEDYTHDMPMCWRTNTPLIYKPITSWYVGMSKLRTELVANNEKINWTPDHVKYGRFGNWLSEIKDWGISRLRYWGTPLPIWKSESGKVLFIGSYAELEKYSGVKVEDPHRPYVDDITFEHDGEKYTRIKDVLDVWYDSGAMPFARFHYPFENKDKFDKKFPAQYIAESVDQTRGWFYSLLAISTALFGKEAYENVVMSGFTLDDKGVKQSKSKKNYTDPRPTIAKFGADAIRFNFFSTPISAGEDTTISEKTLKINTQEFMLPLWNIYSYLITYANIHEWTPRVELANNKRKILDDSHLWDHIPFDDIEDELDAWILVRLQQTIKHVNNSLDSYEIPKTTRTIKALIEDISKWYIRRSRDRFGEGSLDAIDTLYYVFVETLKLLAPLAPFITEYMYRELVSTHTNDLPESIHLTDYPEADEKFLAEYLSLIDEMEFVRKISELGHNLRVQSQIKVRQPLEKIEIINTNKSIPMVAEWMQEVIKSEINVKDVIDVPQFSSSDTAVRTEDTGINVKVSLEAKISEELMQEGSVREIIRQIQSLRKTSGLQQGDPIKLFILKPENAVTETFLTKYKESIASSVTAKSIEIVNGFEGEDPSHDINFNESVIKVKVVK